MTWHFEKEGSGERKPDIENMGDLVLPQHVSTKIGRSPPREVLRLGAQRIALTKALMVSLPGDDASPEIWGPRHNGCCGGKKPFNQEVQISDQVRN